MSMETRRTPRPERKGISRRDFLRFGGTAAFSLLPLELLPDSESETVRTHVHFRFGDHLLSPSDVEASVAVILGETNLMKDLVIWKSEDPRIAEAFAHPDTLDSILRGISRSTVSSSGKSRKNHLEALEKAKQQGAELVITDEWHSKTIPLSKQMEYADSRATAQQRTLIGALVALFGVSTAALYSARTDHTPQVLVKDGIKATAGIIPIVGVVAALGYFYGGALASALDKTRVLPAYAETMNSVMVFLGTLGEQEKRQLFRLTDIRDASMALNAHIVEESIRQVPLLASTLKRGQEPLGMLFFAGSAHATAEVLYRKGSWNVSQVIAQHARETIDFSQHKYHEATGFEQKEAALEDWIMLTGPYNYPIPTYASHSEYQRGSERFLPLSPRAILWREVMIAALRDPEDRALQRMGERLLQEDFGFQYIMSDLFDGYEGVDFGERQAMMDRAKTLDLRKHNYPVAQLFRLRDVDPTWELVISEGIPFLFRIEG